MAVGGAVAVAVAGLTKIFFNHIQKDFLINVWGYRKNIFLTCIVKSFFKSMYRKSLKKLVKMLLRDKFFNLYLGLNPH